MSYDLLIKFQNILRNTTQVIIPHRVKILFSVISSPIALERQKWKSSKKKGILLSLPVNRWYNFKKILRNTTQVIAFLVRTISNVLVMEIGWTDGESGGYILVSCAHSNTSYLLVTTKNFSYKNRSSDRMMTSDWSVDDQCTTTCGGHVC
jgi:hypothetical protein